MTHVWLNNKFISTGWNKLAILSVHQYVAYAR